MARLSPADRRRLGFVYDLMLGGQWLLKRASVLVLGLILIGLVLNADKLPGLFTDAFVGVLMLAAMNLFWAMILRLIDGVLAYPAGQQRGVGDPVSGDYDADHDQDKQGHRDPDAD
ncbi:hypothetical protein GRI43_09335 [Altererythrobacter luteolus]|uniref:Uncharacterized protein n=1 Tax=Pontixanthobacter luteolus TaxID=295089 RepID=A0A6I4V2Q6_9SPHN|nr:hypothetical protein [Pontixanthobacter luteolus]MXP47581.1 hypothetical protein [Pontixanthobacter luteolus]